MKKALLVVIGLSLLLGSCGPTETQAPAEQGPPTPTMPSATQAAILPTPTPLPPPPTPTPLPTNTPAPTSPPVPEGAATPEVVEEPSATPVPALAVTDVMVEIPAGPFILGTDVGNPDEGPAHEFDVPAFQIDKFEVTNADFAAFVEVTGYQTDAEKSGAKRTWRDDFGAGEDNHPVVRVTWNDAVAYCTWLGKRLPNEAEWEKAARGPEGFTYPWGDEWDPTQANVKESGLRGTTAVGSYLPNGYGLHDVAGNVWEWTNEWYQPYPGNDEEGQFYGEKFRVVRGGGWFEEAPQVVTYNRNAADPDETANDDLGFRCAK
jgi:formylglycine-generating enzyme required for sulfatase activity